MSCYVKEAKHGKAIATWSYSYVESRKAGIIKVVEIVVFRDIVGMGKG